MDSTTLPVIHGKHIEMIRDITIGWENCRRSYSWARILSRVMVLVSGLLMIVLVKDVTINCTCVNFVMSLVGSGCVNVYVQ